MVSLVCQKGDGILSQANSIYEPVSVNQDDPRNSDGENVCLSEFPLCHELSLSESPTKRSIFSPFVMSQ